MYSHYHKNKPCHEVDSESKAVYFAIMTDLLYIILLTQFVYICMNLSLNLIKQTGKVFRKRNGQTQRAMVKTIMIPYAN